MEPSRALSGRYFNQDTPSCSPSISSLSSWLENIIELSKPSSSDSNNNVGNN